MGRGVLPPDTATVKKPVRATLATAVRWNSSAPSTARRSMPDVMMTRLFSGCRHWRFVSSIFRDSSTTWSAVRPNLSYSTSIGGGGAEMVQPDHYSAAADIPVPALGTAGFDRQPGRHFHRQDQPAIFFRLLFE
jgi:hypothetical protein